MKKILLQNNMNLTIEKVKKEDAAELLEYLKIVGKESDNLLFGAEGVDFTIEQEEEFIERTNSSPNSIMLIGRIEGKIVGVVNLSAATTKRIAHTCEVGVSVRKEFWGMGIGTVMLSELIAFARQTRLITVIHLGVRSDNVNAIRLYKKLGFEEIGVYKKFFKINGEYFDELLMNLYLE